MPLLIHTYLRIPGPAGQTKYGSVYIERERDAEELSDRDITAPEVAARHLRDTSRILPTDGYFPLGALWFSFSFFSCSLLPPRPVIPEEFRQSHSDGRGLIPESPCARGSGVEWKAGKCGREVGISPPGTTIVFAGEENILPSFLRINKK